MRRPLMLLAQLTFAACHVPIAPCVTETRQVARYAQWHVVCLPAQGDLETCAVWPVGAPDWLGDPVAMHARGVLFHAVTVCQDVRLTDTPQ